MGESGEGASIFGRVRGAIARITGNGSSQPQVTPEATRLKSTLSGLPPSEKPVESTPPSRKSPPSSAAGWVHSEYQRNYTAKIRSPEEIQQAAEIDAANTARLQAEDTTAEAKTEATPAPVPTAEATPSTPKVEPFINTTIPDQVFEPEVPEQGTTADVKLSKTPAMVSTKLPESILEPQHGVPGEHQEVNEFLNRQPRSVRDTTPPSPGVPQKKAA